MKVLITTVPFGSSNQKPIIDLKANDINFIINPLNKKLTENELINMVDDIDVIIAGTEPITRHVMDKAKKLKLISRVGIGLDSVDLVAAREKGILVSYTPDAPAPAVAELTMGLVLTLLRFVHVSNIEMHHGRWHRFFGRRLSESSLGIIGMGRIGKHFLRLLKGFDLKKILVNDIKIDNSLAQEYDFVWASKEEIYSSCDIITIHTPLTAETHNLITTNELKMMNKDAILINTARGGIINELDLYHHLSSGGLAGAAIDVFNNEPYDGPLKELNNCILTSHMGSMSYDCRSKMEIEATEEAIRFINSENLLGLVPQEEYDVQIKGF